MYEPLFPLLPTTGDRVLGADSGEGFTIKVLLPRMGIFGLAGHPPIQ